jgi:hypothetical protein
MSKASLARSGMGRVSKSNVARGTVEKMLAKPAKQPSVPSNIPGAGPAGVPPAERDHMGDFSRKGNAQLIPTVISVMRGQEAYGPPVASSVARTGGQVRVSPGQFGAWARPLR